MPHSCSLSKIPFSGAILAGFIGFFVSCAHAGNDPTLRSYDRYVIVPADPTDDADRQWADYLSKHLAKRSSDKASVVSAKSAESIDQSGDYLKIVVDYENEAKSDYRWTWDGETALNLQAKSKTPMLWSLYQLMTSIGSVDSRFSVTDLPIPTTKIGGSASGDFPFEYRSIYSPSQRNEDLFGVTACGNIDYDWAIWGHNLHKAVGTQLPADAYAEVDGVRNEEQYCFSSETLYQRLEAFILDQYGDGTKGSAQFVIMPNDNSLVCQCSQCRAKGNTSKSATPAASQFIERLAKRFPKHLFFTSSYASMVEPPARKMPDNVGVLISAMDLPLVVGVSETSAAQQFRALLRRWKSKVNRIYIWDYMRNFDDYLTPYPMLYIAQERLKLYREEGVKGVFYNGSGEDYATFDETQTFVLSALMVNPDIEIEPLIREDFKRRFPELGGEIADYYLSLEAKVRTDRRELPYYGGIGDMVASYLDPGAFTDFYESIEKASKKIKGEERGALNRLLTGLNFTRLELMRLPNGDYDATDASVYIENLAGYKHFPDMSSYREAHGSLISYMGNYEARPPVVKRRGIKSSSHPQLVDGYVGLPTDYHTNWMVTARNQPRIDVQLELSNETGVLHLSALYAPRWGIFLPKQVELWQGNRLVGKLKPYKNPEAEFLQCDLEIPYAGSPSAPYTLRIVRGDRAGKNTMAFDEITN